MPNISNEVIDYIRNIPENRKTKFTQLHELIVQTYPDTKVDLSYNMPTYKVDDGWVALANQKSYVSLYTCGAHHLALFKQKHPDFKTGKGCINFRVKDELPLDDLVQVIQHAIEHPKG